ncbi:MAG TPA: RidA family protein [Candidatus Avamphibacillus sp.]|nr:RidA family protein [Candidatus Avamphibacillus sp.]
MSEVEGRLSKLGIELPTSPPAKQVGNLIYTSGQDCRKEGILAYAGKIGLDLSVEQGYKAAQITIINNLAVLKDLIGDLDRIKQIVKLLGFVNSADNFVEQPYVMNGASDFLEKIFGEKGKHSRSAISSNELPFLKIQRLCNRRNIFRKIR